MNDQILEYLVKKHGRTIRLIEKELCLCFKDKDVEYIHNHYPKCLKNNIHNEKIDMYWTVVNEYMKEHHAELLMEAYMMVGNDI